MSFRFPIKGKPFGPGGSDKRDLSLDFIRVNQKNPKVASVNTTQEAQEHHLYVALQCSSQCCCHKTFH